MNFKLYTSLLLLVMMIITSVSTFSKAEDPIYEDKSTAASALTSIINSTKTKILANGTDTTVLSFKLNNATGEQLLKDFYEVSIKSSNGTLTPLTKDAAVMYTSTFTAPTSGIDSKIDVMVKYKYYACEGLEAALDTLDDEEKLFYADGGFSLVNSKIIQLTRGISNEEMEEIIYEQGQNAAGLEDWTSEDREGLTDYFYELLLDLKCYKPGESSTLTQKVFTYVETTAIGPVAAPTTPEAPKASKPAAPTTYTTRTGGLKNSFMLMFGIVFTATFGFVVRNKIVKK